MSTLPGPPVAPSKLRRALGIGAVALCVIVALGVAALFLALMGAGQAGGWAPSQSYSAHTNGWPTTRRWPRAPIRRQLRGNSAIPRRWPQEAWACQRAHSPRPRATLHRTTSSLASATGRRPGCKARVQGRARDECLARPVVAELTMPMATEGSSVGPSRSSEAGTRQRLSESACCLRTAGSHRPRCDLRAREGGRSRSWQSASGHQGRAGFVACSTLLLASSFKGASVCAWSASGTSKR